jgi:hypothetical protein
MKLPSTLIRFVYTLLLLGGAFGLEKLIPKVQTWTGFILWTVIISCLLFILCFQIVLSSESKYKLRSLVLKKLNN